MNWRVLWLTAADDDTARYYLAARADGAANAFTAAVGETERVLSADPTGAGESRAGNERLLIVPPLSVFYEVYPDQRTTVVTKVRYRQPN